MSWDRRRRDPGLIHGKHSVEVTGGCPATLPLPVLPIGSLPPSRIATTGMLLAAPHVWVEFPLEMGFPSNRGAEAALGYLGLGVSGEGQISPTR